MKTRELSERFKIAYNNIDKKLKQIHNNKYEDMGRDIFTHLVSITKHPSINAYREELKSYGRLRNAIVHSELGKDYYIAEPHVDIVEKIEKISKEINNPTKAIKIAAQKPKTITEDEKIGVILEEIKKYDYSSFPVYKENEEFVGILTTNGMARWLADNVKKEGVIFDDFLVKDVLPYEYEGSVEFISELDDVYTVKELFEKQLTQTGNKLETVLISNGKSKKRANLKGIITPWDLIKIKTLFY